MIKPVERQYLDKHEFGEEGTPVVTKGDKKRYKTVRAYDKGGIHCAQLDAYI